MVLGRPHLAAYAPAHEASNAAPIIQKRSRFKRSGDRRRPKETEERIHVAALSDCCALRKLLYKQVVLVKAPPRGLRRASVLQASGISQSPTARSSACTPAGDVRQSPAARPTQASACKLAGGINQGPAAQLTQGAWKDACCHAATLRVSMHRLFFRSPKHAEHYCIVGRLLKSRPCSAPQATSGALNEPCMNCPCLTTPLGHIRLPYP